MKWLLGVMLVALAATVAVNVLLLGYGGTPNDPVGRLSPIAHVPQPTHVGERHARSADD